MWRFLAGIAVLFVSQLAWADLPALRSLAGDRKSTAMIDQGRQALENNDPARAILVLEDAYRYWPKPGILYLLGRAALLEGRTRSAIDLYRRYIEQVGDDAEAEVRAELTQVAQQPLEVGADLTVAGVPGGLVTVDDRLVGSLPLATPVQLSAGKHQVVLTKEGRKVEATVTLLPRRAAEVRFTLKPPLAVTTLTPGVLLLIEPQSLEPGFLTNLRKTVSEAVGRQRAVLVSPDTQASVMAQNRELEGCLDQPSCQEKLAMQSNATYALRLEFQLGAAALSVPELQSGSSQRPVVAYRYSASVLDVEVGAIAATATDSCVASACNKLMSRIADMVGDLLKTAANKPRGTLLVSSEPAGATVKLGPRNIGSTPLRRDAFIGPYELVLEKSGYYPLVAQVLVEDNRELKLDRPLIPLPVVAPSRSRAILKWTTLGLGIVSAAAGATLLGLNGRPMACSSDPTMTCPFDGRAGGAALLTIGTLSLGGSLALFLLDAQKPASSQTAMQPTPATPALSLSGSF